MVYGEPRDTAKLADDVYRALTKGGFHVERFQMNGKVIQCLRVTVRQYDYVGTKIHLLHEFIFNVGLEISTTLLWTFYIFVTFEFS